MKVMTFNIQHGRNFTTGKIDLPKMAETILQCGGEVVGLNEVYGDGNKFECQPTAIASLLEQKTGLPHYAFFACAIQLSSGPYGNGLVSRYPIAEAEVIPLKSPPPSHSGYYEDRCILKAQICTPEGPLTLLICHFGLQEEEAALAARVLAGILDSEQTAGRQVVLMGDFNLSPQSPLLLPLRERMTDTDEFCEGDSLTFPSDEPTEKIDYIFVSRDIRVKCAEVPEVIAADHRPITAEIFLP